LGFFIDIILPATIWPGDDSATNRNEYQEYLLGGGGGKGAPTPKPLWRPPLTPLFSLA